MLAKKKAPPITNYLNFFKALRLCHEKYGFEFKFYQGGTPVWDDHGWAYQNCIWCSSSSMSLWNPIEVVHHVFYSPKPRLWCPASIAYKEIGLPQNKYEELVLAFQEARGHYIRLRVEMCEALGLKEVPVSRRPSYREVGNMDKRRR